MDSYSQIYGQIKITNTDIETRYTYDCKEIGCELVFARKLWDNGDVNDFLHLRSWVIDYLSDQTTGTSRQCYTSTNNTTECSTICQVGVEQKQIPLAPDGNKRQFSYGLCTDAPYMMMPNSTQVVFRTWLHGNNIINPDLYAIDYSCWNSNCN
ncbi:unnamed protein product, partial [Rotaria sp. Silwood1]